MIVPNSSCVSFLQVALVDRSLMPGDVVRRLIEGQDSQRGYVRHTDVMCHCLLIGKRKVVCNVNSKNLIPLKVEIFTWTLPLSACFSLPKNCISNYFIRRNFIYKNIFNTN